jgi:pimeloyl-ACP methyl ester carboxylesterase
MPAMQRSLLPPATMRSETFPYADRFALGPSKLGALCYFDSGAPPEPRGLPPILLIHALGLNLTGWEYVAPALARHTRVIGIDLPGCGRSAKPRVQYRLAQMEEAVLGLLDYLKVQRAVIFGHSFGGRIAMELALSHPERVRGLVLMASAGLCQYPRWMHVVGPRVLHEQVVAPIILVAAPLLIGRIFGRKSARTRRFVDQVVDRYDPRYAWEFARYACPMLPELMGEVGPALRQLNVPVQVLWGEDDHLLTLQSVRPALSQLPQVRVRTLPGCGHMPNIEQPEEVVKTTLQFLAELAPAPVAPA